ncbi:phosphotransferase [Devosia sp. D6-9]|nr:phosphotransferase [Devosia sp. D6-9]
MMNQSPAETALSRAMIRWSLTKATPVTETPTSTIYKVEQNGRDPAALKVLKPGKFEDERRGGAMLAWYGGEGAVTVFDSTEDAVFMEWVEGATLGDPARAGRDDEATEAFGHVVQLLHKPRETAPDDLIPLRDRFQSLFATNVRTWPYTARDLYARAVGIGLAMFDKPSATLPLHGDLHHDNILSSPRGWLAIDPKGLLGDPTYEVANAFLNPLGAQNLVSDPGRIARLADSFSARLGFNRKRILGFAAAHAALSACWDIEDGNSIAGQLDVLPHLLTAYDKS